MYVVTGASEGLGYALSSVLADRGEHVIGVSRREPDLGIDWIEADLAKEQDIDRVAEIVNSRDEQLKGVAHAAGILVLDSVTGISYEDAERVFRVNTLAPARLNSKLMDRIVRDGSDVVFVSSTVADRPKPINATYGASKAALNNIAGALRVELAGHTTDARSVAVNAGAFATKMVERATGTPHPREASLPTARQVAGLIDQTILQLPKTIELDNVTFYSRSNRPQ